MGLSTTQKTHLRNSSALSAADISVTVPFGIYSNDNQEHKVKWMVFKKTQQLSEA